MESHGFRISGLWLASLSGIEEREDEVIIETFRRALHWFVGCVSGSFFHHEFYEKPICDSLHCFFFISSAGLSVREVPPDPQTY